MALKSDLIAFEILSRLPTKSVVRFKSVCKQWLALSSDPVFVAAHNRCNPLTVSGLLIQEISSGCLSSFSVDGGASPVLPDPSLSSLYPLFAECGGFLICQSCNGLLLCRSGWLLPSLILAVVNPTTMVYRKIPNPPADTYPFKYHFMLAFDPSTSFQYRIVCIRSNVWSLLFDPTATQFHVQIYSSDTGAWQLSRVNVPGGRIVQKGVYWNGALNWVTENRQLISFDVDRQIWKGAFMPSRDRNGLMLYFGESRGYLHFIETVADVGSGDLDWLRFLVFEMGKDDQQWSLLYNLDLSRLRDMYTVNIAPLVDEISLRISSDWGVHAVPIFFARGEGEDDKLYVMYPPNTFCCNLAGNICREIVTQSSAATILRAPRITQLFPFAHGLFAP